MHDSPIVMSGGAGPSEATAKEATMTAAPVPQEPQPLRRTLTNLGTLATTVLLIVAGFYLLAST